MAEQILLDLEIPTGDAEAAINSITRLRNEVEQLKKSQQEIDKSSPAWTKQQVEIKKLSGEMRKQERLLIAMNKVQDVNNLTIEEAREQLKVVSAEWARVTKLEGENTEQSKKLEKAKTALTERLKEVEKATGDNRRNVGNYSDSMKEALQTSGLFTREQQALAQVQAVVKTATQASTKSINLFKVALAATGIGAVVLALGTLVTYLTSTQAGMDKVTAVTRPLVAIFEKMKGVVQELGGSVFKGLGLILKGDIREGIEALGSGLKDAVKNTRDAIKDGAEAGKELDRIQKQIERTEIELTTRRTELNRVFEESKSIAQDITKSEKERVAAAKEAMAAQRELADQELELLNLRIEKKEIENSLNDTLREDDLELQQLIAQRSEFEARAIQRSTEARNQLNTIREQGRKAREAEANKELQAELKLQEERAKQVAERAQAQADREERQFLVNLQKRLLAGEITEEEFRKKQIEREVALAQAKLAIRRQFGKDTLQAEQELQAALLRMKQFEVTGTKQAEAVKQMTVKEGVASAIQTIGEGTALGKALSIAQATINTYEGASKALAQGGIAGPILAAIVTAQGLLQVSKIANTKVPGFAGGVIGIDGPGSETSDDIPARISKNESVITAKATKKYAPVLAAMEASVGNQPNWGGYGKGRFANGVIGINQSPEALEARSASREIQELKSVISEIQVFTSITEQERAQERLGRSRNFARYVE